MYQLISGGIMTACWILSFFFLRFWFQTNDRLFMLFSTGFFLMGIERLILGLINLPKESDPRIYLIRLLGFLLIIIAIVDKNRPSRGRL